MSDRSDKLNDEGYEAYPWKTVWLENAMLVFWIVPGTVILSRLSRTAGWLYLLFALLMILVVMRRLICTYCYYYGKRCHTGWGRIAPVLYEKRDTNVFGTCAGQKIAPLFFGVLALLPLITGIVLLIRSFSLSLFLIFVWLLTAVVFSSVILRKKSCAMCKMRWICPGSAAR